MYLDKTITRYYWNDYDNSNNGHGLQAPALPNYNLHFFGVNIMFCGNNNNNRRNNIYNHTTTKIIIVKIIILKIIIIESIIATITFIIILNIA